VTNVVALTLLKAPMPPPLVDAVQEVVVESALDLAGSFSIRFGIAPNPIGDWSILDVDPFKPLVPVGIRVGAGTVPVPRAVMNGFATAQRASWAEGGKSILEVRGIDLTGVMNLEEKVTSWPCMPDGAIAAAIFGQYGAIPKVTPTVPRLIEPLGTPTQRGTDIRFLRRLARRNGFDCYVQPEPFSGLDVGVFGPPSLVGKPSAVLSVAMGSATNVKGLSVRYDMSRPTMTMAAGMDPASKTPQPALAPVGLQAPMGVEPGLLRLMPGAGLAGTKPLVRAVDTGSLTTAELQPHVQAITDRASFAVVVEATTGAEAGIVLPGDLVALRGAGRLFGGLYQITRSRLTVGPDQFEQQLSGRRNAVTMTGVEAAGSV
jgi:hypothetical protein